MPCGDTSGRYEDDLVEERRLATRAACDMRTILRRHKLEHELTRETITWILKHDQEDTERIAIEKANGSRERSRARALDKLTMEERRVLGL